MREYEKIQSIYKRDDKTHRFIDEQWSTPEIAYPAGIVLYGEGYGAKVQKGGENYKANGVDFVLFDVLVGDWWLLHEDVEDVARQLGIATVPVIGRGPISQAVDIVRGGFPSKWGAFPAEGLVLRTPVGLCGRNGHRVLAKLKTKDWA